MSAAVWSAIAACCSAISSFLIFLVQRSNLLESARPELLLSEWRRYLNQNAACEVISFRTIKNVGRGAALHVLLTGGSPDVNNHPTAILAGSAEGSMRLPILEANGAIDLYGEISIWWKNVPPHKDGGKYLPIKITIFCWDSRGRRHQTEYTLLAVELSRTP